LPDFLLAFRAFHGMRLPVNRNNIHPGIDQFEKRVEEAVQDSRTSLEWFDNAHHPEPAGSPEPAEWIEGQAKPVETAIGAKRPECWRFHFPIFPSRPRHSPPSTTRDRTSHKQ